jgi:hypothetical protein
MQILLLLKDIKNIFKNYKIKFYNQQDNKEDNKRLSTNYLITYPLCVIKQLLFS